MKLLKQHIFAIFFLSIALIPTSSNAMFRRVYTERKKQLDRLEQKSSAVSQLTTLPEVEGAIEQLKKQSYDECLLQLKNITGRSYVDLKNQFDDERVLIQNVLKRAHPLAIHDANIPVPLYEKLKKIYEEDGYNLHSTAISYTEKPRIKTGMAASIGISFRYFRPWDRPKIFLYGTLLKRCTSENEILFILNHEKSHICLQHISMTDAIDYPNAHIYTEYLISAQEREADIHAASKNSQLARAGMLLACHNGHEEIIDKESHCAQMQTMYALMLQKEKLEERSA